METRVEVSLIPYNDLYDFILPIIDFYCVPITKTKK